MDHAFYIISSNEQESGRAKQIVGTKDDDLPVCKEKQMVQSYRYSIQGIACWFCFLP